MNIEIPDCKEFTGYKPCHPGENGETCINPVPRGKNILIINLGALGAVLMTTTILPAIKRKFPESTIYWLTSQRAAALLEENHFIDKIFSFDPQSILVLKSIKFDIIYNTDKILEVCGLTQQLNSKEKLGFGLNENGVIIPLNKGAEYNYQLGINNELKFVKNDRTYPDMLREMCDLDDKMDPYIFSFSEDEIKFVKDYKNSLDINNDLPVIGINTGSSPLFELKRIPYNHLCSLIEKLFELNGHQKIILLGGIEDEKTNLKLKELYFDKVINTPTTEGIRRGMAYVNCCDIVISSDSLGMHMAIAFGKKVAVWFNVTCAPEVELFGKGEKIISEVECSPCWKQVCDKGLICHEENISQRIEEAVKKLL